MWWLLLASLASGQEASRCDALHSLDRDQLSVAWVSPLKRRAKNTTWIPVVETSVLRDWLDREGADTARLLQMLGLRKRSSPPSRAFKVTIFEVNAAALCRPVDGVLEGELVDGQPGCIARLSKPKGNYLGCGYTTDLLYFDRGVDLFYAQWKDVAETGFCVLPAERFVRGE
jgi:hypothetical protein